MYIENHSLGEWFKRRLMSIMEKRKTPFAIMEVRSANCTRQAKGGHSKMNDVNSLSHTQLELQISYSVCAKIPKESVLTERKEEKLGSILRTLCNWKRDQDHRSRGMSGPCPHADRDTAKDSVSSFMGYPERKKQPDALREVSGTEIQVPEPGILVPRVLRGHSREKCKEDTGVHPTPVWSKTKQESN